MKNGSEGSTMASSTPTVRQRMSSPSGLIPVPSWGVKPSFRVVSSRSAGRTDQPIGRPAAVAPDVTQRPRVFSPASRASTIAMSLEIGVAKRDDPVGGPPARMPSSFDRDEPMILGKRASCVGEIRHRDQHVIELGCRHHLRLPRPRRRGRRSVQSRQDWDAEAPAPTASSDAWKSVLSILPW
jgi:hypothetical protein